MELLMKRRRQDVQDQYDECSAAAAGKAQSLVRAADVAVRAAERDARRYARESVEIFILAAQRTTTTGTGEDVDWPRA